MCGIAGFLADRIDPTARQTLSRMIQAIRHRGPDASGDYTDNNVALGHARLSIIDLAGGRQPIANEDGTLQIVFNGEIYNYLELREEMSRKGHRFKTRTDTEVILHLYEEMGESCVSLLNGQWAFAIWDLKKRILFLSRDRFGVRPLFYTFQSGVFIFASEIKAIFAYPGVSREIDAQALAQIFTFWHTLPPRTAFRGIFELPPGNSAVVAGGEIRVKQYWDICYAPPCKDRGASDSEQEYANELLNLMTDACRLRLRSDVPVGAYLSGGLDSTFIGALARQCGANRLRTFSVRFDEDGLDEGVYQKEAVRALETEHSEIRCSSAQVGAVFPAVIEHIEKPILRTAPAPLFLLSRLVRQSGYKVVLTGEGSDELLGGYDIYKETKARAFCAARPHSGLRPLILERLYPYLPAIQRQPAPYLRAFFGVGRDDERHPYFSHHPRWKVTASLQGLFSRGLKSELGGYDPTADMDLLAPPAYSKWDAFTRAQYLETRYLLPGYILSSQGDRVAMAHSVEGRFPFLDHRVAAFSAALPSNLKMRVLKEKYLLKRCAAKLVPDVIVKRYKQPYRAPDASSFLGPHAPEYVRDLLSPRQITRFGMFDPAAVGMLLQKAAKNQLAGVRDNMAVVGVISTQLLIHRFTENCSVV